MRWSIALAFGLVVGCDSGGSGFTGDYETVEISAGACGAAGMPQPIGDEHWFQLADVDTPTGLIVGYFPCVELGMCRADYDLYASFGRDGDRWLTTIAIALDGGAGSACTLRFRERTLRRSDDATIEIEDVAYEEVDASLSGETCAIAEARRRGTTMPCAEQTVLRAESRAF